MGDSLNNNDEYTDNLENVQVSSVENSKSKKFKIPKFHKALFCFSMAVIMGLTGYNMFLSYCINRNKYFSNDNLFDGNSISDDISDEEIQSIVSDLEEKLGCEIVEANTEAYCLLNAISDNRFLNETEKEHFYKYIDLIIDNPYLDKEEVYNSLLNVTIHNYLLRPSGVSNSTQGDYGYKNKIIRIFNNSNQNTIGHEGIHCIFSTEKTQNLPQYFDEGMTELLNNEYCSDKPFYELYNYPFEVSAVKMLCEITSSDTVLKAFTYGDMNIIAEDLANTCGSSVEEADEALEKFALTFDRFKSDDFDFRDEEARLDFCEAWEYFDKCCAALFSDDAEKNSYYYYSILIMNMFFDDPYQCYSDDLVEHGYEEKAYFSSKLKQKIIEDDKEDENAKLLVKSSQNAQN